MQNRILSRVFFYKRCIYGSEQAENGEKLTPVSIDILETVRPAYGE